MLRNGTSAGMHIEEESRARTCEVVDRAPETLQGWPALWGADQVEPLHGACYPAGGRLVAAHRKRSLPHMVPEGAASVLAELEDGVDAPSCLHVAVHV